MNKQPTPAQLKYIRANINTVAWHELRNHLQISDETMMAWSKQALQSKKKKTNLVDDVVEFEMNKLTRTGIVQEKKVVQSPMRNYYLVTFDHSINFVVKLSRPVPHAKIMYAPSAVGCDYEVHPLGLWEYYQLCKTVPTLHLDVTPKNYTRSFWLSLKLALHEA